MVRKEALSTRRSTWHLKPPPLFVDSSIRTLQQGEEGESSLTSRFRGYLENLVLATHAEMETVLAKERLLASSLPDHILELRHGSILWQNVIFLYYDLRGLCIPDLRLDTDWSSGLAGGHEFQVGVTTL